MKRVTPRSTAELRQSRPRQTGFPATSPDLRPAGAPVLVRTSPAARLRLRISKSGPRLQHCGPRGDGTHLCSGLGRNPLRAYKPGRRRDSGARLLLCKFARNRVHGVRSSRFRATRHLAPSMSPDCATTLRQRQSLRQITKCGLTFVLSGALEYSSRHLWRPALF
jgi:hypothetical protein